MGSGEPVGFFALIGLARGATELFLDGTAPTVRSVGVPEGDASLVAGVALTVPDALAVDDGLGLGVGDVVPAVGGKSFINSRRSSLFVLPLCA